MFRKSSWQDLMLHQLCNSVFYVVLVFLSWIIESEFRKKFCVESEIKRVKNCRKEEEQRERRVLENIFPKEWVEMIIGKNLHYYDCIIKRHDDLTVGVVDLVDFNSKCKNKKADTVVRLLHKVMCEFDRIMKKCQVEKIKTMCDLYLFCNLRPFVLEEHLIVIMLELLTQVHIINRREFVQLKVRMALSSGPCVSYVMGENSKKSFEISGTSLYRALRLEKGGRLNTVIVDDFVRDKASSRFDFEPVIPPGGPGQVPRGKGLPEVTHIVIRDKRRKYNVTELEKELPRKKVAALMNRYRSTGSAMMRIRSDSRNSVTSSESTSPLPLSFNNQISEESRNISYEEDDDDDLSRNEGLPDDGMFSRYDDKSFGGEDGEESPTTTQINNEEEEEEEYEEVLEEGGGNIILSASSTEEEESENSSTDGGEEENEPAEPNNNNQELEAEGEEEEEEDILGEEEHDDLHGFDTSYGEKGEEVDSVEDFTVNKIRLLQQKKKKKMIPQYFECGACCLFLSCADNYRFLRFNWKNSTNTQIYAQGLVLVLNFFSFAMVITLHGWTNYQFILLGWMVVLSMHLIGSCCVSKYTNCVCGLLCSSIGLVLTSCFVATIFLLYYLQQINLIEGDHDSNIFCPIMLSLTFAYFIDPTLHFHLKLGIHIFLVVFLICSIVLTEQKFLVYGTIINTVVSFFCALIGFGAYHLAQLSYYKHVQTFDEDYKVLVSTSSRVTSLLYSCYPPTVISELDGFEKPKPMDIENGTIMFVEIMGYNRLLSESNETKGNVKAIVGFLHQLFSRFDTYLDTEGITKVKNFSSFYIACSGDKLFLKRNIDEIQQGDNTRILNRSDNTEEFNNSNTENSSTGSGEGENGNLQDAEEEFLGNDMTVRSKKSLVKTAVMMKNAFRYLVVLSDYQNRLGIRIGLHSGNFCTGIIGVSKLVWDVYGDAVNHCFDLTQHCRRDRILASAAFLKDVEEEVKFKKLKTEFENEPLFYIEDLKNNDVGVMYERNSPETSINNGIE